MRLNVKAVALTGAIFWGGCVLLMCIANVIWAPYGGHFLEFLTSIYPGYQVSHTLGAILLVTVYAILDGLIGGAIFGWLYNRFVKAAV